MLSIVRRVQQFAAHLLADSSSARDLAAPAGMCLAECYLVLVVRVPEPPLSAERDRRDRIVEDLLRGGRVPITWEAPGELVALLPTEDRDTADRRGLDLARGVAAALDRSCSVGAASGRTGALADVAGLARRVSATAPAQSVPRRLHTVADLFVELGVTQLPEVDGWLRRLAERLVAGPDLIGTLDAYYQHDMNRLHTASALCIHPRTLDYRLRRVRELVDIDPGSTRGVRILSATVARALAVPDGRAVGGPR
jgi:sugar diacid utilization regulator